MQNGWIKLYRKSLESIIFTNEKGWKIWTWCLMKANHKNVNLFLGRTKVNLTAGQFIMGRNTASEELGMAVGTIWYWLDILEKEGQVERKSTNKYSIITILKWKEYQGNKDKVERRLNADRTQIGQQIEPDKNDKNVKNDKKKRESRFAPPSLEELKTYCEERKSEISPQKFLDFYESKGWLIGKNKMKDWRAAVRTWENRDKPVKNDDYFLIVGTYKFKTKEEVESAQKNGTIKWDSREKKWFSLG